MAEYLSPGIYVEEIPSQVPVIAAASTSNFGIAGFAPRGPEGATLITSFDEFTRVYGGLTRYSFLPHEVAAFFANGGRRAYVVRVAPANATAADCKLRSNIRDQQIETGDGTASTFTKTGSTTLLRTNSGASPLVPGTTRFRWRSAGTAVTNGNTKKRDGTTNLVCVVGQAAYEGRLDPAALPTYDSELDAVVRGTVVITMTVAGATGAANTFAVPVGTSSVGTVAIGNTTNGGTCTIDHRSGRFSIRVWGTSIPASGDTGNITANFVPASTTIVATDDGAGALVGAGGSSTITYSSGAYTLTTTGNIPHAQARVLASYTINAWDLRPASKGAWGNDLLFRVTGNVDHVDANGAFTKFNIQILLRNDLGFETVETYDEIDFTDPTSETFVADVLNELSDFVTVEEPGSNEVLSSLQPVPRTQVLAAGDNLALSQTISATLANPAVARRSVRITWVDGAGVTRVVTDNGAGLLVGDVDGASVNTITYQTGVLTFKTVAPVPGGSLVTAAYRSAAEETAHDEAFGDASKSYTAGTDGTFDANNYGRNQFTSPTLVATGEGIFALNTIDEVMQVALPDFAGNVVISGDLLDYADSRVAAAAGGDRFIILATPKGLSAQEAADWFRNELRRSSDFAAFYWPWIEISDPLSNNRPLLIPPGGHIAGAYARTDATRNVGKSPAGLTDGKLSYLIGLERYAGIAERDLVHKNKINPIVSGATYGGTVIFGTRTISNKSEWRYIGVRRLFMFLERSIFDATGWVVFEGNGPALWTKVKSQINGFLNSLYVDGYFKGNTPDRAYRVICDESNNDANTIDAGQLIIDVAVAPYKPAEFVRIRFQQLTQTN